MKRSSTPVVIALGALLAAGMVPATVLAQEFEGRITLEDVSVPGVDKDGDGCLSRAEVTPGGQLDKRFDTRDVNGDGKLCKDEYFAP